MATEDTASQNIEPNFEDVFQILVATDIHLGYAEDDPVRGPDTFDTLEEILKIAVEKNVDFILLGGDLFHHAQPSTYCINKCMELLKKYCLGDRPVSTEFLSDPSLNFSQTLNPVVNYEDPNMNISIPVFSIHGNHDDPTGKKHVSALNVLSTSGLINYFGRCETFDKVNIYPILLRKGKSKLALYGLSHIRDERLGRLWHDEKVKISTLENKSDWFHLLVWHQNRAARGNKNFIPDSCLPEFLDLVIWGHEHDCRIKPEQTSNNVFISQPGSSVATSLSQGESIVKNVGLLQIYENNFKMIPIELTTVRPFIYAEITLKGEAEIVDDDNTPSTEHSKLEVAKQIDNMIRTAKSLERTNKVSEKPLIRLLVKYKHDNNIFNSIRFGQLYTDKVANPENMVKFQLGRDSKGTRRGKRIDDNEEEVTEDPIVADRVEDLVVQYFEEHESLSFFPMTMINQCVKRFVDSSDANAISDMTEKYIKEMCTDLEKDLPDIEATTEAIKKLKANMDANSDNFVDRILDNPNRQQKKVTNRNERIMIDNEDDNVGVTTSTRGKGKGNTRGKGATRARKGKVATSSRMDDDYNISSPEDDAIGRGGSKAKPSRTASRPQKRAGNTEDSLEIIRQIEDSDDDGPRVGKKPTAKGSNWKARRAT